SRRERSAASSRLASAATAAWLPNGWPSAGVATRTSGAGRSGIGLRIGLRIGLAQAVELLEVHEVVDAEEEQPFAAAQVADQRMLHAAALHLVTLDACRRLADRATRLVEQGQQVLSRRVGRAGDRWGDGRRAILRPRPARVERRPRPEEAPCGGRVGEGLGDVPVLLTA